MASPTPTPGDLEVIRAASTHFARLMAQPRVYERIRRRSGVELDKVGEILLNAMVDEDVLDPRLSDIAARLGVELSTVSRKVQKLVEAGLVTRSADPADARATRLVISEDGRDALTRLRQTRSEILGEVLTGWPADERARFAELFKRFTVDLDTYFSGAENSE